jgi:hypothetical protein
MPRTEVHSTYKSAAEHRQADGHDADVEGDVLITPLAHTVILLRNLGVDVARETTQLPSRTHG